MENNKLNFDNVLLCEKHDVTTTEAVKVKSPIDESEKILMMKGVKLFRVVKPIIKSLEEGPTSFEDICHYDAKQDHTDLSNLKDYRGYYMVSVDVDKYNNFEWNCFQLDDGTNDNEVFSIKNPRKCTDEEVKLLNKVFPEYYDNAFVGK